MSASIWPICCALTRVSVRLSRNSPTEILGTSNATSLAARVSMANSWPADYFISIHCNSNVNPAINGSEVYVYRQNTQAYWLAQHVLNGIVARMGTKDNGVRLNPACMCCAAPTCLPSWSNWPT